MILSSIPSHGLLENTSFLFGHHLADDQSTAEPLKGRFRLAISFRLVLTADGLNLLAALRFTRFSMFSTRLGNLNEII